MRLFSRRLPAWLLAGTLLLSTLPVCAAASEPPAPVLLVLELDNGPVSPRLSDNSPSTGQSFSAGQSLQLSAKEPFGALYLRFAAPPAPYRILVGDTALSAGGRGFLHELIELPAPVSSLRIELPAGELCELDAFSATEPLPDWVERWEPPAAGGCDLLLFPTHADDEVLYFGAAIALAVQAGREVQVAYLTNHWETDDRPHELLEGLWELGVRRYPLISPFPDRYAGSLEQAKQRFSSEELLAYQVEALRRCRPQVVIGHDLAGEYGHGAHILGAQLLTQALSAAADPNCFPESAQLHGVWDVPKCYLHLYDEGSLILPVREGLSAFGGRSAFEVAEAAYEKHVSQHVWSELFVSEQGADDCRRFGLYRTLVGADTPGRADLFEHIPPVAPPQEPKKPQAPEEAASAAPAAPQGSLEIEPPAPQAKSGLAGIFVALFFSGLLLLLALALFLLRTRTRRPRRGPRL